MGGDMSKHPRRPALWSPRLEMETRSDGTILVQQADPLGPFPARLNDRLLHWAKTAPRRTWMAQRDTSGGWRKLAYGEAVPQIEALAQAMLERGLSVERPLLILSGNSISHALMALAAQHVGIPSAAISPAYSLLSSDHAKLRDIAMQLTPGMIFVEDATPFAPAILSVFSPDTPIACVRGAVAGRECLTLDTMLGTPVTGSVERAFAETGPDTVAKFLFTSGTTGSPKAVILTQRLLCSNQEMVADCYRFMREEPPVVVDWAPWNHTASGNKVFNLVIYNGGTYYIDEGRPTPEGIRTTVANLREVSPTWYFNVPIGYRMLLDAMENDDRLRRSFFARLSMMMYAGAGMSQPVWDRLNRVADAAVPGGVLLCTGYGSTETGPFALSCTERQDSAGNVGIPARGVTLKLVPHGDRLEARIKGPSITPGYWRNPDLTAQAFDDEGFYRLGDALRFARPGDPDGGFLFDGRLAENFKLDTGTWVAVGPLRASLTNALKGLASDAIIAGENRPELAALVVPDLEALRALVGKALEPAELLAHPKVRAAAAERLADHAARATGSATRVTRIMFLSEPLSFDRGEVTDKGSVNQRAVLRERAGLVEALFSGDSRVILPATREAPA
jgi:feruloyl-CoA synthase